MSIYMLLFGLFIFFIIRALLPIWIPDDEGYKLDADKVPDEIKNSSIHGKEKVYRHGDYVSKPDATYKNGDEIIIGEVKSRKGYRYYPSDVIQMSVSKVVLEGKGHKVSDHGQLKVATPKGAKWMKVPLLNKSEIDNLRERYFLVQNGKVEGKKCTVPNICKRCEYYDVC